jgi:PAS domain S-box-containing protein
MSPGLNEIGNAANASESLRLELEGCQRRLDESQKRAAQMEDLFAHVADAIFVAETDGRILDVNLAACALLGYGKEELLAMHPWDFVVSASQDEILGLIQKMRPQNPATVQRTYRCKSGEQKVMDLRLSRCNLAGRDLVVVSCRDITEQKCLENRLRQSERNLAEGQRLTKTGSWILDYKTGNTDWSVETCRIFGFPDPPPSPHYSEFRARVRPEDRDAVDRGLRESFETGEPRPLEYIFILPDGVRKNIETISQPVRDERGAVVRLMGTVMDVTERKAAEEALRASEKLARGQVEALTRTLDALAMESAPDRLVEHVLRTIATQLGAHGCSVWQRVGDSNLIGFQFSFEDGRFVTKSDSVLAGISLVLPMEEFWAWPEVVRTGKPGVMEDIRELPFFSWQERLISLGVITILIVPMSIAGRVDAVIGVRFTKKRVFSTNELELAQALANQAMLALQLTRLSAQSRESAVIAERNRMARDIHDTLAQGFTGVIMQLEAAKGAAARGDCGGTATHIERAGDLARSSLGEARRSVRALRPRSLKDGTLYMALEDLLKRMSDGIDLNAELRIEGEQRAIPPHWEEGLLRITQESLTNTIKHAQARNFRVTLDLRADEVGLQLVDDGLGFDPQEEHDGFGLLGMKERADQIGGRFVIRSKRGVGTEILVTLKNPITMESENGHEQL